jgi:hypothetical protein
MSDLSLFLKKNKKVRSNAFYAATKSLVDAKGEPIKWEIKPLTTAEDEAIREQCTHDVPVPGKKGQFRTKIDVNAYMNKQMCAAIVFPDLDNAELQDSYEVKTPEELLKALVDDPSEYSDLRNFIQELSGFDKDMSDEVEEAKN